LALYLDAQTIKAAIGRLGVSTASSSLGDYLIFKRTLQIAEAGRIANATKKVRVVTGMKSRPFVQAIMELAQWTDPTSRTTETSSPYFVPFGAMRDRTRGYRSSKFVSNGPSDTVGGWQARSGTPVRLVENTSPKEYEIVERTQRELQEFFLIKAAQDNFSGERPQLLDSAIWWHRTTDLQSCFEATPTDRQLIHAFVQAVGLTQTEYTALFESVNQQESGLLRSGDSSTDQDDLR
jgi:hypothetical protein